MDDTPKFLGECRGLLRYACDVDSCRVGSHRLRVSAWGANLHRGRERLNRALTRGFPNVAVAAASLWPSINDSGPSSTAAYCLDRLFASPANLIRPRTMEAIMRHRQLWVDLRVRQARLHSAASFFLPRLLVVFDNAIACRFRDWVRHGGIRDRRQIFREQTIFDDVTAARLGQYPCAF